MKKVFIFGGAAIAALLPAGIGLAANPSLSARVPLAPAQVRLTTDHRSPTHSPTHSATTRPSSSATDDHGGARRRGASDDPTTHDLGDDHGGDRKDGGGHQSGKGKGGGSDD